MIEFINSWVQGIVVAVIITTILEMILPNGNSKKYIRVVLGIYVLFHILTPVIEKVGGQTLQVNAKIWEEYATGNKTTTIGESLEKENASNIREIYLHNLKKDMKAKVEERGFVVEKIEITLAKQEYKIEKICLKVQKEKTKAFKEKEQNTISINEIGEVKIEIAEKQEKNKENQRGLTIGEKNNLKQLFLDNYAVETDKILINEE